MNGDPLNKRIFYHCAVESVEDDQDGLRIKVVIPALDSNRELSEIPYCFPFIPKFLHVNPKVGESVNVIIPDIGDPGATRYFTGPNISQPYNMGNDPHYYSAQSLIAGETRITPLPHHKMDPENEGNVPDRNDIALQGRSNADLKLKEEEIRIRCGFKKTPSAASYKNRLHFNKLDLAYIQMRHGKMKDLDGKKYGSVINIVADKINLLSHQSPTHYNLSDPKKLIPDDELQRIVSNSHPLVYGDDLVFFLKQLINVFREHVHNFNGDPPCFRSTARDILSTNLDDFLSKSVTTN